MSSEGTPLIHEATNRRKPWLTILIAAVALLACGSLIGYAVGYNQTTTNTDSGHRTKSPTPPPAPTPSPSCSADDNLQSCKPCSCQNTTAQFNNVKGGIAELGGDIGDVLGDTTNIQQQLTNITNLLNSINNTVQPCPSQELKYYAFYSETVLVDTQRTKNGTGCNGCNLTAAGGPRLIALRVFRRSLTPGNGSPLCVSELHSLFAGGFGPNYPTLNTTRCVQLSRTYLDNTPVTNPLPGIIVGGAGGTGILAIRQAEEQVMNGVGNALVVTTVGTDTAACPTAIPGCAGSGGGGFPITDFRAIINITSLNLNPALPLSAIQVDGIGTVWVCIGGSASANGCIQASGGITNNGAVLNGLTHIPGIGGPEPRLRAVFLGDSYIAVGNLFQNFSETRAAIGMWGHGFAGNWPKHFYAYPNAAQRVYYDLKQSTHGGSGDLALDVICDRLRECIRVYVQGVNTTFDNAACSGWGVVPSPTNILAYCEPGDLLGLENIPNALYNVPRSLAVLQLRPYAPTSGLSIKPGGDWNNALKLYPTTFFKAVLNNDASLATVATTNVFPNILNGIYVNRVPPMRRNGFNLQNTTLQFDIDPSGAYYIPTMTPRTSGPIPNPSLTPGAFSLFGNAAWSRTSVPQGIALNMSSFPFPSRGRRLINSTQYIWPNGGGVIHLEAGSSAIDNTYNSPRLGAWFSQSGLAKVGCFGPNLANFGAVLANSTSNKVWVLNSPTIFRITWYRGGIFINSGFLPAPMSSQCSFFPNGTITIEFDDTILSNITEADQRSPSFIVGVSNGRAYVDNNGKYQRDAHPNIRTFTELLQGTVNTTSTQYDAVYEEYTAGQLSDWNATVPNTPPFNSLS